MEGGRCLWRPGWVSEGAKEPGRTTPCLLRVGVKLQEKSLGAAQRLQKTLDAAGKEARCGSEMQDDPLVGQRRVCEASVAVS